MYRTAFLPALVALFVAAFALTDRPVPARSGLPTDAFSGDRAFGTAQGSDPQSLQGMAAAFPSRPAGSAADAALADLVARVFAATDDPGQRSAFVVRRTATTGRTAAGEGSLTTVVATRPGISNRRIVVLANRDATASPGLAELSATATLLELARVFRSRELRKTLVLVSTSGATTGFAGARAWARSEAGGPVDGVIVLGDMAGTRVAKPWVVGWPSSAGSVPLALERTVEAATRRETRSDPGGPRAVGQWVRRALPLTLSGQGPIGAEGLPVVLLSESGELGPAAGEKVRKKRLQAFGRSALRAVDAIDAAGPKDGPAFGAQPKGIVTLRNVLPDWAVRLIVGSALLPALLAALDALFRARRRHVAIAPWICWLTVAAVPLPAAWLWLRLLGAIGALAHPDGPVATDLFPLQRGGIVAMASAVVAGGLACWGARLLARALTQRTAAAEASSRRPRPAPGVDGLAVATGVWLCAVAAVAWLLNPYAAALLIPATHLWLFAAGSRRGRAVLALLAGIAPALLVLVQYGFALDIGPLALAWGAALGAAAGTGAWSVCLFAGLLAALAGVVRVLFARRRLTPAGGDGAPIRTRGPLSYAGPGSLGGTESALRR